MAAIKRLSQNTFGAQRGQNQLKECCTSNSALSQLLPTLFSFKNWWMRFRGNEDMLPCNYSATMFELASQWRPNWNYRSSVGIRLHTTLTLLICHFLNTTYSGAWSCFWAGKCSFLIMWNWTSLHTLAPFMVLGKMITNTKLTKRLSKVVEQQWLCFWLRFF